LDPVRLTTTISRMKKEILISVIYGIEKKIFLKRKSKHPA